MPKVSRSNLTVGRVSEFKHEGAGQAFLWDSTVSGLAVRATSGSKVFIFERRLNGKTVRITIGNVSAWPLPKAREEGRKLARMMDEGIDPRAVKAEQKAEEEREGLLVSDVWGKYIEAHQSRWSARHLSDNHWLARLPKDGRPAGILHPLMSRHLVDIDAATIIQWMESAATAHEKKTVSVNAERDKGTKTGSNIQGRGAELRQGYIRARAFFRWVAQRDEYRGVIDPAIFAHDDLKALLPKSKPKNDTLEKGQLAAWFEAVRGISSPVISAYLQILLLTGARRNELADLKWSDVDFQWKALWVRDKVEGEEGRKIPLTPYVEHLLSRLPRRNEWAFSSVDSASGRMMEPRIAHKRALSAAGLPSDLSLHGLRRSFSSLSEWCEMPVGVVAQIMGHRPSATAEKHYKRRPLDLLAVWHGKLESWILEQAGVTFDAKVAKEGLHAVGNTSA